jgi:hypothetical protein
MKRVTQVIVVSAIAIGAFAATPATAMDEAIDGYWHRSPERVDNPARPTRRAEVGREATPTADVRAPRAARERPANDLTRERGRASSVTPGRTPSPYDVVDRYNP